MRSTQSTPGVLKKSRSKGTKAGQSDRDAGSGESILADPEPPEQLTSKRYGLIDYIGKFFRRPSKSGVVYCLYAGLQMCDGDWVKSKAHAPALAT